MSVSTPSATDEILAATRDLRVRLLDHPIYNQIRDLPSLRIFMKHHVFAVLDFMWLLKRLQRDLCCLNFPWLPPADRQLSRFINEIVLGEESDEDGQGGHCSHFEIYLQAMSDVQVDTEQISAFVDRLHNNVEVGVAAEIVNAPASVKRFVDFNHHAAANGTTAEVAAVFCFGREDIIPEMFQRLLETCIASSLPAPRLSYYIRRHIELDGDHHGPLTRSMVDRLCTSPDKLQAAIRMSRQAIELRIALWDGVLEELTKESVAR